MSQLQEKEAKINMSLASTISKPNFRSPIKPTISILNGTYSVKKSNNKSVNNKSSVRHKEDNDEVTLKIPSGRFVQQTPVGNTSTPKRPKRSSSCNKVPSSSRNTKTIAATKTPIAGLQTRNGFHPQKQQTLVASSRSSPRFFRGNEKKSPLSETNWILG